MLVIVLPLLWWIHGAVRRRDGQVLWAFIAGYGLVRTIVEFYREPGIVYLGLTGAQYLTIAMFILGVVMYWQVSRTRPITSASGRVRAAHD
jgi:phosphatidylglycerol:prolipoprotein diacylglycerol transferase